MPNIKKIVVSGSAISQPVDFQQGLQPMKLTLEPIQLTLEHLQVLHPLTH